MKRDWRIFLDSLLPRNDYKFAPYSVQVIKHNGRQMAPHETDFISSIQRQPLQTLAVILCKYEQDCAKLELIQIAMKFHIYRKDFGGYLLANKKDPMCKRALKVWNSIGTLKA